MNLTLVGLVKNQPTTSGYEPPALTDELQPKTRVKLTMSHSLILHFASYNNSKICKIDI